MQKTFKVSVWALMLAGLVVFGRQSFALEPAIDNSKTTSSPAAAETSAEKTSSSTIDPSDNNSAAPAREQTFEISVSAQNQPGSINFVDLNPADSPRLHEVLIEVKSNLGRQYQVSQNITAALMSIEGQRIPLKNISLRTLPVPGTKGAPKIVDKSPLKRGSMLLFLSDLNGSSDKFKTNYELTAPADLKAGSYLSQITYTLSEI